jgi:EmrB/QacA subfamily drug resistance transporter
MTSAARRKYIDPPSGLLERAHSIGQWRAGNVSRVSDRQKRLTLVACILGSAIVFIDGTVVNVALPAIRGDLDAGLADQQWIVEAYLLTLGSLILIGGSLSDLYGRRRVFGLGTVLFGVMSFFCAIAPSAELLIAARALQGIAGALLVPSTLATIVAVFPESERGRAIGSWTAWSGVSTVIGPLAGGVLVDAASWRWVFAINLLPVAGTLYLIATALPETLDERHEHVHVDVPGAVLCALGLAGPVFALIEQPHYGWGDPLVFVPLLAGLALLGAFVWQERRSREPMLPLSLFSRRNFAIGNLSTLTIYAGLGAATFFLAIFLQETAGYSALAAGLSLMPLTVMMFFLSSRFGALADRAGPHLFMSVGPILAGVGLLLLIRVGRDADYATEVLPGLIVFGLGLSMTVAPLTATVLGDADERHAGIASGVNNAIARVAGLLAIAALGAVVSAQFASAVDSNLVGGRMSADARQAVSTAKTRTLTTSVADSVGGAERAELRSAFEDASVSAFRLGIGIAGGLVVLGGLVSALGIQNPRRKVLAAECPGGAICGASEELARDLPHVSLPRHAGEPAHA